MKRATDLRRGRTCVYMLHIHLVLVTKYRRRIFTPRVLRDLADIFAAVCGNFEAKFVECNGEDDHVHLLINYPPKVAVSRLVNKGSHQG